METFFIILGVLGHNIACGVLGMFMREKCGLSKGAGFALGFFLCEFGLCKVTMDCFDATQYLIGKMRIELDEALYEDDEEE